jgi:hypothetical protein
MVTVVKVYFFRSGYSVRLIGALTSKTYALSLRRWDLRSVESCDIYDDFYSKVRIESFGIKLVRVIPVVEGGLRSEWITNAVRFGLESLLVKRLYSPVVRVNEEFASVSWFDIMCKLCFLLDVVEFYGLIISGSEVDGETLVGCKEFSYLLEGVEEGMSRDGRFEYVNEEFSEVEFVVLLNVDLRRESPLLEVMLRVNGVISGGFWLENNVVEIENMNIGIGKFISGRSEVCARVMSIRRSVVIYGYEEEEEELGNIRKICNYIERRLYVHNKVYGLNMKYEIGGFSMSRGGIIYNVGNDRVDYGNSYVVYQGSHILAGGRGANCLIPSSVYLEFEGLYNSSFGEVCVSKVVFDSLGLSRRGWRILLFIRTLVDLEIKGEDSLKEVRRRVYERTCLLSEGGYKFKVIEIIGFCWLQLLSFVRYDRYVDSYYKKITLGRLSRLLGVGLRVEKDWESL